MNTYRVLFTDGTSLVVEALNAERAKARAYDIRRDAIAYDTVQLVPQEV